jgi:hypothetical protein
LLQPRNSGVTGCTIDKLLVRDNVFKSNTPGNTGFYSGPVGAASVAIDVFASSNNVYDAALHDGFTTDTPITTTTSVSDQFYSNRVGGRAIFSGVNVTLDNPLFKGNTSGATGNLNVNYTNTGVVRCSNATYINVTNRATLVSPSEYIEQGWNDNAQAIANTSGAKLVSFYSMYGNATSYANAAPTTGTWRVGDRVFRQTAAVGSPKSWVCTVGSTPGPMVWVSEGNL